MNGYSICWFLAYTAVIILTTRHWGQNFWVDALLLTLSLLVAVCFIGLIQALEDENGLVQAQKQIEGLKKDLNQAQLVNRVLKSKVKRNERFR